MLTIHASDLQQWIVQLLWPLTRVLGCIAVVPLFSHPSIPNRIKLGIGFVITLAIAPSVQVPVIEVMSWQGMLSLLAQVLIGISMGFVMRIMFTAVEMAGFMMGMSMGLGFASFFDPQSEGQTIAVAQFLTMLTLLVFMSLDGHLIVVAVMLQSFETMPILLDHWQLNGQAIAELGGHIFSQGLLLSLPVVASLLITNMALGILTKAAPQFNIFGIGFPVTISVGMVMTLLSLPSLISPVNRWLIDAQQLMLQVIR
ncbi:MULTISPECIES: flagellar biosynthetic protein FliR [unclassified Methylophilus]|jgi:flagellar biosynthesis protein FliR|uniref:flagellar biosynthetic protein FliR n=1 Tax=unclassified Methylophilus TaxID=2630143 RepID=UPI0006FF6D43|nr:MULTISPECIES: flagellar biosynthetic protein FliR [unclassified Methylophilus]KQT34320.1 flagellar biosynthetic protein FliR [Methylophilus sp. Leaf414]KQT37190.1 flagellar biosynthetic protein FliR [Methylophilus sp. Leaf416]KQT55640.1 flagellar biosynthetic protein FliR [Methylophilus sp. Leaf459]